MSVSELLVIFLVALLVFDAKKLPMLAHHVGRVTRGIQKAIHLFQQQYNNLSQAHQLTENEQKAKAAELGYTLLQKENIGSTESPVASSKDTQPF